MDGDDGIFSLGKTDLHLFRGLEGAFRSLLRTPDLSPEDIVGLARAIRCIQRLPQCTPGTDVSVSMNYRTRALVACSIIRLSSDEVSADYSASSWFDEVNEYEHLPSFTLRVGRDGEYETEGDKEQFFTDFSSSAETIVDSEGYLFSVEDNSTPMALQPCADDEH